MYGQCTELNAAVDGAGVLPVGYCGADARQYCCSVVQPLHRLAAKMQVTCFEYSGLRKQIKA